MGNNALDAMDTAWEGTGVMEMFYESINQSRGGGPGGKDFVGCWSQTQRHDFY